VTNAVTAAPNQPPTVIHCLSIVLCQGFPIWRRCYPVKKNPTVQHRWSATARMGSAMSIFRQFVTDTRRGRGQTVGRSVNAPVHTADHYGGHWTRSGREPLCPLPTPSTRSGPTTPPRRWPKIPRVNGCIGVPRNLQWWGYT